MRGYRAWLLVLGLVSAAALAADGGTLRVVDRTMGDYRVSVYTDPTPPRPDSLDVSVLALREGEPGTAPGLDVRVRAWPTETTGAEAPDTVSVAATREQAEDPRYYAAKFAPGATGPWRVEVTVRGAFGEGRAGFDLVLREPGPLQRSWVILLLALLPIALVTLWLVRKPD